MSADFTFYWHDYETFGRVPRRDRPSQFAGVRTDADLNEIGTPARRCAVIGMPPSNTRMR